MINKSLKKELSYVIKSYIQENGFPLSCDAMYIINVGPMFIQSNMFRNFNFVFVSEST